jgi:hypothetical protein
MAARVLWEEDFMKAFWIIAMLLIGGLIYWGLGSFLSPNNGDAEFQKMLEATEHVKSFRGAYVDSVQHLEKLWEVDCNRSVVHKRSQTSATSAEPVHVQEDQLLVGIDRYNHDPDGSWVMTADKHVIYSGQWYCENLAKGTLRDLLPDFRAMLRNAMIGKGDKKTVNGVRCQDWQFAMKSRNTGEHGTVCIGLEDHLPYEMTTVDSGGRYSYSDYNHEIKFDASESILQSASSNQVNP